MRDKLSQLGISPYVAAKGMSLLIGLEDALKEKIGSSGLPLSQLCEWVKTQYGVDVSTSTMKRKLSTIGLPRRPPGGGAGILDGLDDALMNEVLSSSTVSVKHLRQWLKEEHEMHVCDTTVRKKLRRLGVPVTKDNQRTALHNAPPFTNALASKQKRPIHLNIQ